MNKYFALRKANRMRTKLLNEKSQEQLKEVIRYLRRVSWDFYGGTQTLPQGTEPEILRCNGRRAAGAS